MKKIFVYSIFLSLICFAVLTIPSLALNLIGVPAYWNICIPLSFALVLFLKGKVGKYIYGEENTHQPALGWGIVLVIIEVLSDVGNIRRYFLEKENNELSSLELFSHALVPVLAGAFAISLAVFILLFIINSIEYLKNRNK